jgi:hypothetical protein
MATTNKNSQYIQSLVDFILDTKPYHSKLTEVVEEYQFFDEMNVKFVEGSSTKVKINPTYLYNFYSGGDSNFKSFPVKQLHSPLASSELASLRVGVDENTDMASVPFVYSKKTFDGIGVADVRLKRASNATLNLIEGLDWFQSHGSMQFQLKQNYVPLASGITFVPTWAETRDDGVVWAATLQTRELANDTTNPTSALNKIGSFLGTNYLGTLYRTIASDSTKPAAPVGTVNATIQAGLASSAGAVLTSYQNAQSALQTIQSTLVTQLPQDYEALLDNLVNAGAPLPAGFTGWIGTDTVTPAVTKHVSAWLSAESPSMYFYKYSDSELQESGLAGYDEVDGTSLQITDIVLNGGGIPGDTWTVIADSSSTQFWNVYSGLTGLIGSFDASSDTSFASSSVNFAITSLGQPVAGETLSIKNHNRIVFGGTSPLETWNLIKVNPLAYDRPVLHSTRFGYIQSPTGVFGQIQIIDQTIPTSTVFLTARADGVTFDLTSSVEPTYHGVLHVNVPFNDGRLAFTIKAGSVAPFVLGDEFILDITNEPSAIHDLDLGYGYDLDTFDNQTIKDENDVPMNFAYDTRFTDYNFANLGLTISQAAITGRAWRMRAIPNTARQIATLKKDGSGPSNWVDLQDATSGVSPDPSLTAPPLYAMPGDVSPDLKLFHADSFTVEYSDDGFNTVVLLGTATVDAPFSDTTQGISFNIVTGSKPFVAVQAYDNGGPIVSGGDVFTFSVLNAPPFLDNAPVGLTSPNIARMIMNGDGFHEAPPAAWSVSFTSSDAYSVSGLLTEGDVNQQVPDGPLTGTLSLLNADSHEGNSFNDLGVHFTIVPGPYGLGANDSFTFNTFSRKPSYLVHGSASGFTEPAVVGESYWNGFIGFKLDLPSAELYNPALSVTKLSKISTSPDAWGMPSGALTLTRLRFDAVDSMYYLTPAMTVPFGSTPSVLGGWYVKSSIRGPIGYLPLNGSLSDKFITLIADHIDVSGCIPLQLKIDGTNFDLWNAQDTVIVRPAVTALNPATGDMVLVDKRTSDRLAINLDYTSVSAPPSMTPLLPETTDVRFIDTFTGPNGVPLENTSPETAIVRNFIPLLISPYDSDVSPAEFSDVARSFDVYAAATGQAIGTLTTGSADFWPATFTWDAAFFGAFLPLNAAANFITYGSGFNDHLNVRIRESAKFLIDGGALTTDFLFHDDAHIVIAEANTLQITTNIDGSFTATIADGPFGGFLPGYDVAGYDAEIPNGYYSNGQPLTSYFHEAIALSALSSLSTAQQIRLDVLLHVLDGYLNGTLANTTLAYFLAKLDADDPVNYTPVLNGSFGYPAVGLATNININVDSMDIRNPSVEGAGAQIFEAIVMFLNDTGYALEQGNLDIGPLDLMAENTAVIFAGTPPLSGHTTMYDVSVPARKFQISYTSAPSHALSYSIQLPSGTTYAAVAVQDSPLQFTVSLPIASVATIIVA